MKCSKTLCLLLVLLSVSAGKKKPQGKQSIDAEISETANFGCLSCLKEHAPQCIPLCFPNPFRKPCIKCLLTAAVECLEPCGNK